MTSQLQNGNETQRDLAYYMHQYSQDAAKIASLEDILRQVTDALESVLSGKPVRNVDEIILAAREAIK